MNRAIFIATLFLFVASAYPAYACIKSSQRYEGPPQSRAYVVTVTNQCESQKVVTVRIVDYKTMGIIQKETFKLSAGETKEVFYFFSGEKLLSYEVSYAEE